jgi:hypothetical protein
MPIERCTSSGKPGYKYGPNGTCYTYTAGDKSSRAAAQAKAEKQGRAIKASQEKK